MEDSQYKKMIQLQGIQYSNATLLPQNKDYHG